MNHGKQSYGRVRPILLHVAVAVGLVVVAAVPTASRAEDQDILDYRAHIMKTLEEQTAALGLILSRAIPEDNAAAHMEAIAVTATTALKAFEPKVAGGEAKPAVWSNWADFSKRMNEFAQKTAKAAKSTKEKGLDADIVVDALSCKGCHDVYRAEKKK